MPRWNPAPVMALAPTGALCASINLGNAVLTNGDAAHRGEISVDLAAGLARRLGVPSSWSSGTPPATVSMPFGTGSPTSASSPSIRCAPMSWPSPVLPVEVSVDHSLAVEAYAAPEAQARNEARELDRHAERFGFLKWAASAMPSVHLNPPGTGIMHTINLEQLATVGTVVDGWLCPSESHTPRVALRG